MGLIRGVPLKIKRWLGLNSYQNLESLTPQWWTSASNVLVNATGVPEVLRSPKAFNPALSTGNKILSAIDYDRNAGHRIIYDINTSSGANVATYSTDGTTNTSIRTGQANSPWVSVNVNDRLYRINGSEFVQLLNDLSSFRRNGIDPPAAAPTISYVAGGSGTISSGITASYAYYNTVTAHCSRPSGQSNTLGATGANHNLRIPVTASGQTGVDKIVVFLTLDGGSIPYLNNDSSGNPVLYANTTGNIDIDISTIIRDTLTPETVYNYVPPTGATFMFKWKDRLLLLGFTGAETRQSVQYSGFESTYFGQPWESWPFLNIINISNKDDSARGGIETQLGALIMGEKDSYLISGYPSDKTQGPEASVSISEHMEPLSWNIGTKSPKTIQKSSFGIFWLDQGRRIRIWDMRGTPEEIAIPIRDKLDQINDSDAALAMAEARWYQYGKNGGYYVLTASKNGTTNDTLFIVTVYKDPETREQFWGFTVSDIAAQALVPAFVNGRVRFFYGATDRIFQILDPDLAGDGWGASQSRFFEMVLGNDQNFNYYHSLRFDGAGAPMTVTIKNPDGTESKTITMETDLDTGGSFFGLIDEEGRRKLLRLEWNSIDTAKRDVRNMQIMIQQRRRDF